MREYLDLVRISFPAFAKAAASELKDLDDLKSVKEENRALLEETTEVLALYSKLQQVGREEEGGREGGREGVS